MSGLCSPSQSENSCNLIQELVRVELSENHCFQKNFVSEQSARICIGKTNPPLLSIIPHGKCQQVWIKYATNGVAVFAGCLLRAERGCSPPRRANIRRLNLCTPQGTGHICWKGQSCPNKQQEPLGWLSWSPSVLWKECGQSASPLL